MVRLRFFPVAGVFALMAVVTAQVAPAQPAVPNAALLSLGLESGVSTAKHELPGTETGSFEIAQHGHAVGTASYKFASVPKGVDSTSLVKVAMQGLDYALSKNEELTATDELEHVQLSAIVNGEAVTVAAKLDAEQFVLDISANGRSTSTRLAAHKAAVFLPDFDAGALQTLLTLAVAHNSRDLWAIVPKQAGTIEPVQLATYADQVGTLDGKQITVHHLVATIAGANTDLFSGPENQLLQAELPQQGFALVRKGFVLTPPAKPAAPAE